MSESKRQLFITGCGRSGTSMVAGLFRDQGRYMGSNLHPARESNPLGFFESPEINQINEQILIRYLPKPYRYGNVLYGADSPRLTHTWLARLPEEIYPTATKQQRKQIAALTSREGFCYKDTRFCYTIHEWLASSDGAKVICVFRDPSVGVASMLKECHTQPYLFYFAVSINQLFEVWESMYRHVLNHHYDPESWLILSYQSILSGTAKERLQDFAGMHLDFSFPQESLNRPKGNYELPPGCGHVFQRLKHIELKQ